jgi:hypothetical protein
VSLTLSLVAFLIVTAGASAAATTRDARAPVHPHAVAAFAVPVRVCATETAVAWQRGPRIGRQRGIAVPERIAAQVAVYTDEHSATAVLGPRGWRCSASYGSGGGATLVVYAPGEHAPGFFPTLWPPRRSDRRELVFESDAACVSCVLTQACPYFAHARHLLHAWGYWSAITSRACRVPPRERVSELSPTLMSVVDPRGVLGTDVPSGGPFAAIGDVGYVPMPQGSSPQGSYQLTCALPAADHALCYAALHWFAHASTG